MSLKNKLVGLLIRLQKFTKTDMIYLAKGSFWLSVGSFFGTFSSFLLAVAFANLLTKSSYGEYNYVLTVASILAVATLNGMDTAIIQTVATGYKKFVRDALKVKLRWGLLASLASAILALYYYLQGNNNFAISFAIAAVFVPIMESFSLTEGYLHGQKLFSESSKYRMISRISNLAIMTLALFLTKSVPVLILVYFISWSIIRITAYKIFTRKYPPNELTDPQAISYGKHLSVVNIISVIANQIDKVFIFQYLGPVDLAIYSFAMKPVEQFKGIFKIVNELALPKFSEKDKEIVKKTLPKKMAIFAAVIVVVIAIYIPLAPIFFRIFFPAYTDSVFLSQLLSISLLTTPLLLIVSYFFANRMVKELYTYNIAISVVQIILVFVLTYYYGLIGAVLARIIFRFFNMGLSIVMLRRS